MKAEVYSWRVSRETKMALEREARRAKTPLAALLDHIAEEWLASRVSNGTPSDEQARLRAAAAKTLGSIEGGQGRRAENARSAVKDRLRRRHGR